MANNKSFDEELVKSYPKSNKKIKLQVKPYELTTDSDEVEKNKAQTTFISPHGLEFQVPCEYSEGTLLKIDVAIPDFWNKKQNLVDYNRIDHPSTFKVLAKVVKSENIGKRGKKKLVLAQTVNIDSIDEEVLKQYLQEGK